MSQTAASLSVRDLGKTYTTGTRSVRAIDNLNFDVAAGELVCVVGPSGCGKTTLLRTIAGLLRPTTGELTVDGRGVTGTPPGTAVVFQEYGRSLFPWLRVGDNVALPLRDNSVGGAERRTRVREALEQVGLADAERSYPWQLSGGMQQRVAIARALAYRPRLLLMDEPFAAVDAQTRADLEDLVYRLWRDLGVTVVFITHDIDEAVYLGQRVLVLSAPPSRIREEITVDLPVERDQLTTRADPRFLALRTQIHQHIRESGR
ncbi:ABC transporter ATP-binding protein [Stackebrandtia nassauensis]|uniref:ABC transporter related protein n=1 Tax=Stackebrandtia nassauensis (strain DSM 44728 / CIP 108903 / NRRL B-16338 / NBRC 102104 / LLR-40K-21) TaxID=446470 RepID=D3Q3H9_STANL|nr:ATP-binding cassette domain-containing protein [Stackebrandtia nassauensis]ADD42020.1 ABC transporter related protein [Stackebrandtia nassauensis DSM 44728]